LGNDFKGRLVQGDALDREALLRAGIEDAHGLAAVTSSDSANIVTARIARDIFGVEHVVARVYDPQRTPIYEKLGLQTVASSSWGARRIEQLLLHPGLISVASVGNGDVLVYEISVPEAWAGRALRELLPAGEALPVALVRGGRAQLPEADSNLQAFDIVQVSASQSGAAAIRRRLDAAHKE
jgi:trk system potassium uptake protein TrkA